MTFTFAQIYKTWIFKINVCAICKQIKFITKSSQTYLASLSLDLSQTHF